MSMITFRLLNGSKEYVNESASTPPSWHRVKASHSTTPQGLTEKQHEGPLAAIYGEDQLPLAGIMGPQSFSSRGGRETMNCSSAAKRKKGAKKQKRRMNGVQKERRSGDRGFASHDTVPAVLFYGPFHGSCAS
ncbi:hypothetical protein XA68_17358 [Ophiocordyceps unilateralis]|uniref:Uncharacterized protein n=1 Tax=Ophiocordyceps unilateralis TaxID=268505 RepID=A0A2A9PJP6_OPHUN|nr:hypothetical protein XA68_17358 [Ophiocordyceps unilateralis]